MALYPKRGFPDGLAVRFLQIQLPADVLDEAKRKSIQIDAVVLSGGASQMPIIKRSLGEILEDDSIPVRIYRPCEAVSFGAARYAEGFASVPITVKSISASVKGKFVVGQTMSANDINVWVTMSDGERLHNPEGITTSSLKLSTSANKITVSYKGVSTVLTVYAKEIIEPTKAKIESTPKPPMQTSVQTVVKMPIQPVVSAVKENKSNSILVQKADYSYGILVASQDKLDGEVLVLIKGDEQLPAVSKEIRFRTESGNFTFRIYKSLAKGTFDKISDVEKEAQSVMRMPFELPINSGFSFRMTVQEDYNIKVECIMDDGMIFTKNTSDSLGQLFSRGVN